MRLRQLLLRRLEFLLCLPCKAVPLELYGACSAIHNQRSHVGCNRFALFCDPGCLAGLKCFLAFLLRLLACHLGFPACLLSLLLFCCRLSTECLRLLLLLAEVLMLLGQLFKLFLLLRLLLLRAHASRGRAPDRR